MKIVHTMPLLIRGEFSYEDDLRMAKTCFESLRASEDCLVVLYNQGCLCNDDLRGILTSYGLSAVILGHGENIGIARARQTCFEYIWEHCGDVEYISEIHVDMVFPPNWHVPLVDYLASSDEPMISPGIVTMYGELQPISEEIAIPDNAAALIALLGDLNREEIREGFVHPVVHKASILREIGGYDTRFLRGKQGYEDDSLLLGYLYYMGTRSNWRPKCYLKSWVYHATMAQRMSLPDKHLEFALNEEGLIRQYGAYGLKRLSIIHRNPSAFETLLQEILQQYR
ncbi:hypothetical protein BVG16_30870 [Paenibacillus selenitireducens]|uniref:Glycosyltransferase 2-like domain-containing protein n=1 Tax=Paenibacillus selenitireducens TaxID=1324314 RepID=A0A1T2WZL8_9BACL|nr:hypothetical protein [Paenibacillus selenitireducens]OPA73070.1 hypothetical protein BVG16_30870 [Paenibacillus selenitireducens]